MRWGELHETVKAVISGGIGFLTALSGALVFMFTNFTPVDDLQYVRDQLSQYETVANAEMWRTGHQQALDCRTVADLRAEIRAIEERLRFDRSLSEADRVWYRQKISDIRAEIARRDPNGVC